MLEHRPDEPWRDVVRCHCSWPHLGQVTCFPGDWLHGVLCATDAADEDERPRVSNKEERVTVVLNLWERAPMGVPALSASEVPAHNTVAPTEQHYQLPRGSTDATATTDSVQRQPSLRTRDWDGACSAEDQAPSKTRWHWHALTVGQFDRTFVVELHLPPIAYRGVQLESFTASVRWPSEAQAGVRATSTTRPPPAPHA